MQLNDALSAIAQQFDLNADELIAYATEDPHDGWDEGKGSWISGSVWTVEGQVLYALVRALKPQRVLELGTAHGCSSTHIAQALVDNGSGHLTCIDRNDYAGLHIPDELRAYITIEITTLEAWLAGQNASLYDFVFEDADHRPAPVGAVWAWARKHVRQGGAVVSHDPLHPTVGENVRQGITASGALAVNYLVEPGDGGLAVWRQNEQIKQAQVTDAKVQKPKRSGAKTKATRKGSRAFKTDERQPAQDERGPGEPEPKTARAVTGLPTD